MMPIDPTDAELDYRAKNYPDWDSVKSKQIACATCGKNLSAKIKKPGSVFIHPFTTTLQCKKCNDFYGDGDFSMDEDGDDKYCRMCGNGGELYICGNKPCPYGLCQSCVDRYIGKNSTEVEADDWKCIHCNCKPLWEVRAVCAVVILEKPRKRSMHRKIPTRQQVNDSDDHSSRVEDFYSDFESSIRANRRSLRSLRKSKRNDELLEKLALLCNSNDDDSLDYSDQRQKFIADKKDSNTANKRIESRANQHSVREKINTVSSLKKSRSRNKLTSSESESTDSDKEVVISKRHGKSKLDNNSQKVESKSVDRPVNKNLSDSIKQQSKVGYQLQKDLRISKSPEICRESSSNSDSESNNESANDFVTTKKNKKTQRLNKNLNPKDLAMRTQRSNNFESLKSKTDPKHSHQKFGNSFKERKTRESLELKGRNLTDHPIKKFGTNEMRNKTAKDKDNSSVENDDQTNGSNKRAILMKKSQASNKVTVSKKGVRYKHDSSNSNKEIEERIEKDMHQANRKNKRYIDSENEEEEDPMTKVSTSDAISQRVIQTKRSSSKPIHLASETSSSLSHNSSLLERRKASIKRSYAKFESIQTCMTKNQASVMKDHVSNLMNDIKAFGKCLCAGADVIASRQLTNNDTSVSGISKTVLKCALIMIRAQKSMGNIESDFIKSYENWCNSFKVKSIFDVETICADAATSDNIKKENEVVEDRVGSDVDDSTQCSDTFNPNNENCNQNNQLAPETSHSFHMIDKTHSDSNEKSIDGDDEDSVHHESSEKIDKNKRVFVNRDNNETENSTENIEKIDENGRHFANRDSDEIENSDKSQERKKNVKKINKNRQNSNNRDSDEIEDIDERRQGEKKVKKIDKTRQNSANRDNDEIEDSDESRQGEKNVKKINKTRQNSADRDSDEIEDSDNSQDVEKNLKKINKTKEDSANRISDKDSINTRDDNIISDCDSREIFSEDEDRERPNETDEPIPKKICMQSSLNITSTKQSVALVSDGSETDNLSSKTLDGLREKSVESDNGIESPTNVQDNGKKIIECMSQKSIEEASRNDGCIGHSDEPNVSPKNLFHDVTACDYEDLSNLKKKSKDSSHSNQSSTNCTETTEYPPSNKEPALCDTEVRSKSPDETQITDDNETSNSWERSATNKRNSSDKSSNDDKPQNLIDDLSPDANEGLDDLSDCDMAEIFTQIPSDNSTTSSTTNNISERKEIVTNATETEDSYMPNLKIASDIQISAINDNNSNHELACQPKEASDSLETIAERFEDDDDSDTDENSKKESGELKTCSKNQNRKIVGGKDPLALLSDNEENDRAESIAVIGEKEMDDSEKKQLNKVDDDSEELLKKKILESDSESSDNSMVIGANNFVLKVNSDSEEYAKEAITAESTITAGNSEISSVDKQSQHLKKDTKNQEKKSCNGTQPVDTEISELNKLAKHRLLSSSTSSSSSETEDISLTLPDNDEIGKYSAAESESASSRTKRKKFDLENNNYYKTDRKLRIDCEVVVRRLDEKVLDQFKGLLQKSKEHQEWQKFKSLVDLNNLKKRKRGGTKESNQSESSSESSSSKGHVKKKRSKQEQEKEETLLDHLEKMKNGENFLNPFGDESDDDNDLAKNLLEDKTDEQLLSKANEFAKDLLIQSSDSENEAQALNENAEETDQDEDSTTKTEKQKKKDISNDEAAESESNNDIESNTGNDNEEANKQEENEDSDSDRTRERKKMKAGLAKRNWRLTDSDSSGEEKKWNKTLKKKSEEKSNVEEEKDEGKQEERSKQKKKVKRRVLGSDSDSVILTDVSDSSNEVNEEKKNSSSASEDSSEIFKNLRTKRRRKRNAGQKTDSESQSEDDGKPAKQKRKRIKKMAPDSDSDDSTQNNSQDTPGKLHRKNIRKVLKDKQVADVTKIAGKEEEERLRRIADRQKLYNEMYELKLASEEKVDKLVLDFDEETKKELVSVHQDLVSRMKPHQAQGIKFMWDACFESLERTKSTKGSGCIVAHCMGLGKSFQVVTLAHTLLTHPETGIKTIMVICPLSTVLNWVNEFKKWLGDINNDEDVEVFEMTKMKKNFERKYQLETWQRAGGVMILGYEMFRLLSNQTGKKMRKSLHERILKCLVDPGPDLIVCDEGHLLKNEDTALSKAMRRVKTLRRIVLTGTPLQNNLVEYHCMVQFVKPNLLGTKKEFLNRFVNPITNGQFDDSTEYDVKLMKKRAHVLHKMLEGSVQRFDYSVLTPFLPPKQEYVITVRLTDIQIKLYQYYLDNFSRAKVGAGTSLFADFQALQRIWTHPIVLRMNAEKMEKLNEKRRMDESDSEGSLKDFLDDGSEEKTTSSDDDSDVLSAHNSSDEKTVKPKRGTRANPVDPEVLQVEEEEQAQSGQWWDQFIVPEHFEDMKISSKLVLLFAILKECEQIGDKVLVFSQSLYALSLIEEFLSKIDDETQRGICSELIDGHTGSWSLGSDYFRLDGQTPPENRSHYCKIFNNPKNSRARLFLISTRAGGLGINLTAANRVIIFDASWNPSHDVQSIFRIYRFGQKKPCYVYRFLAQGTMEEKIYNRQVTKLSLSCRVVDEQQIERHYSNHDLAELYMFEPNTNKEKPTLNLPKDRLLAEIFRKYEDRIETFHEHDSLLENKAEEELDEEERKEAWKEYEDERTGRKMYLNTMPNQNFGMQPYDMMNMNHAEIANRATLSGINIETLHALIRKDYPNTTPEQQTMMTQRAIMDMYTYMENEAIRQQQMAAASFTYPTVSNIGTGSFVDQTGMTPAQRQYALQQQQRHQMLMQREQQANYAKRFGNVRGPALSAAPQRAPQISNVHQDDNDVIEVPTTPPSTAGPAPSSSVQAPPVSAPATGENSKRQEE